jgi:hypothetical protein
MYICKHCNVSPINLQSLAGFELGSPVREVDAMPLLNTYIHTYICTYVSYVHSNKLVPAKF